MCRIERFSQIEPKDDFPMHQSPSSPLERSDPRYRHCSPTHPGHRVCVTSMTNRSTDKRSETSHTVEVIDESDCFKERRASSMSQICTFSPCATKPCAIANAIPLSASVIMNTFSCVIGKPHYANIKHVDAILVIRFDWS